MKPIKTLLSIVSLILAQSALGGYAEEKAGKTPVTNYPGQRAFSPPSNAYSSYTSDGESDSVTKSDSATKEEPAAAASESVSDCGCSGRRDCGCSAPSGCGCAQNDCGAVACRGLLWDPWITFDYMHAWRSSRRMPPLVTRDGGGAPFGQLPGAPILFGGGDIGGDRKDALRLTFGAWITPEQDLGVGGKFFILSGDDILRSWNSTGAAGEPVLARPYYDTFNIFNNSFIVAQPGQPGNITVKTSNDVLGAEAYGRYLLLRENRRRVDFLVGYQYVRLADRLHISNRSNVPLVLAMDDAFDAENQFHGAEIGMLGEYYFRAMTLSMTSKLGIGDMHRKVRIAGASSLGGVPYALPGGLLALDTNIGKYTDDDFALLPEAEIKLTYHLTRRIDASIGYTMLCLTHVALAGDQIDTSIGSQPTVNDSHIPAHAIGVPVPPPNPALKEIRDSTFLIHQLVLGLTINF